jgi:hypothetical protein
MGPPEHRIKPLLLGDLLVLLIYPYADKADQFHISWQLIAGSAFNSFLMSIYSSIEKWANGEAKE